MRLVCLAACLLCTGLVGCTPNEATTSEPSTGGATSTTATPTTGGDTTGGDTTGDPASAPDVGIGAGECDPWAQDCPVGLKCMAFAEPGENSFTGNKCTPVVKDPALAGEPCVADGGWSTGIDDCAAGLVCWNINPETSTGVCAAQCTGSADAPACPESGDICVFWVPGISHVCLPQCDPLLQDCDGPELCLPNWASDANEWVCALDYGFEEGQEFDSCEYYNVCDPGLMCWETSAASECDPDAGGCCLSICDLSKPACNGAGAECLPFYEESAPPDYANVGICALPG